MKNYWLNKEPSDVEIREEITGVRLGISSRDVSPKKNMGETAFRDLTNCNPFDVATIREIKRQKVYYNENNEAVINGLTRKEFTELVEPQWKILAGVCENGDS